MEKLEIFKALVDQIHDNIIVYDPYTLKLLDVNKSTCESTGYSRDELLAMKITDIDPSIEPEHHEAGVQLLKRTEFLQWESHHTRKDGSQYPVEVHLKLVHMDQDYIVAATRDISARQAAQQALEHEMALRRNLIRNSRDGMVILREDGSVHEANHTFASMLGYTQEEVMAMHVWQWDKERPREQLLDMLQTVDKLGDHFITRHHCRDGTSIDVEISTNGEVIGESKLIFCVIRDITERKRTEEALSLAGMVYQNSREAMIVMDLESTIIDVNPRFCEVTGYPRDEAIGQKASMLRSKRHGEEFFQTLWDELHNNGHWAGELWGRRRNGEEFPQWLSISAVQDSNGEVQHWVAQFMDISDVKNAEQTIWRQAHFDPLTDLPNRRMLKQRLEEEIKKAQRFGHRLSLLFLDLDHFKQVNDTLGHEMGDQLLVTAAERLKGCLRGSDIVARLGGDEFVILLLEESASSSTDRVAEKILESLVRPFTLGCDSAYVSTSIGIVRFPEDATLADDMLKKADQAMYDAKRRGRNQYQYFTPVLKEQAARRVTVANALRNALAREEFLLYFQPVINLKNGNCHEVEALLRWQHPESGLVTPDCFMKVAEDTGLIHGIGEWILQEVIRQLKLWHARYPDFRVGINKSPAQFRHNVAQQWIAALDAAGIPCDRICIEITENLLLESSPLISEQLLAYRQAGIQVALDDFGSGYSSMSYLKKFDIDQLKIDKSFIRDIDNNQQNRALSMAIITMAHQLGLRVTAEGVETEAQCALLMEAGCDFAQGLYFSPPGPSTDIDALLESSQPFRGKGCGRHWNDPT